MNVLFAMTLCATLATTQSTNKLLEPGLYRSPSGNPVYVGVEHELPDAAVNQSFDAATGRLREPGRDATRVVGTVLEQRKTIAVGDGPLGVSLYHADDRRRGAVILIHGSDAETREMGFIIPYFVLHGINVISYDQRGTGVSAGNWHTAGPLQRAIDVGSLVDAYSKNRLVDPKRIGVWGFSNGGWTAPIVALRKPIAFMILKSAPAESVRENLDFEVEQRMRLHRESSSSTLIALETWKSLLGALFGDNSWDMAERSYDFAKRQPWFAHSLLPGRLRLPLAGKVAEGWRRFTSYDPTDTLARITTPTLALYGANDRAVDMRHSSRTLRQAFVHAGMRDFSLRIYENASHTLSLSADGFSPTIPERLAPGYPRVMIAWLAARRFLLPQEATSMPAGGPKRSIRRSSSPTDRSGSPGSAPSATLIGEALLSPQALL